MWTNLRNVAIAGVISSSCAAAIAQPDQLLFEQTRIDVGPVPDNEILRRGFKFVNGSARPVTLTITHCHFCPAPESDKSVYQPGESGVVVLELPTQGRYGDEEATADVGIAGAKDSSVRIVLAAKVRPIVRIEPPGIMLPEVVQKRGASETITVTGRGADFAITEIGTDSPWLSAIVGPLSEVEDLGETCRAYDVVLTLKPGLPLGDFRGGLIMRTNDPRRDQVGYSLEARVVGDLTSSRPHITLPPRRPGAVFTAEFDLMNRSGDPLWLSDVVLDVTPIQGVRDCVMDAVPGDAPGVVRVRVTGRSPDRAQPIFDMPIAAESRSTGEKVAVGVRLNIRLDAPR